MLLLSALQIHRGLFVIYPITTLGNVGVGTTNPTYKFYVKGGADGIVSYFGGAEASGIQICM